MSQVYSVKANVRDGAGWAHVFMTTDKQLAFRRAKQIRNDTTLGIIRLAKVVRPAQWVVNGFVAAGNSIN